jgi:hypothetical protein
MRRKRPRFAVAVGSPGYRKTVRCVTLAQALRMYKYLKRTGAVNPKIEQIGGSR